MHHAAHWGQCDGACCGTDLWVKQQHRKHCECGLCLDKQCEKPLQCFQRIQATKHIILQLLQLVVGQCSATRHTTPAREYHWGCGAGVLTCYYMCKRFVSPRKANGSMRLRCPCRKSLCDGSVSPCNSHYMLWMHVHHCQGIGTFKRIRVKSLDRVGSKVTARWQQETIGRSAKVVMKDVATSEPTRCSTFGECPEPPPRPALAPP